MGSRPLHLLREVLDHEVVDADGVSCGMVDDIELEMTDRGPAVSALLIGPGAWAARLPPLLRVVACWICGRARRRIPWAQVVQIDETIKLQSTAAELGLGVLDRKVGRWIARLPMS